MEFPEKLLKENPEELSKKYLEGLSKKKKQFFFLFLEKNIIFLMVSESAQKKSQVNFHLSTAGKRFDSSAQ